MFGKKKAKKRATVAARIMPTIPAPKIIVRCRCSGCGNLHYKKGQ